MGPPFGTIRRLLTGSMLFAAIAWSSSAATAQRDAYRPVLDALSRTLEADVSADGVGSITAAVIDRDEVIWRGGFGYADTERRIQADPRHIYRIGSISKTVTAVVLLQLVERGVVALDDPVVKYLPEFARLQGPKPQVQAITLRQLASHTGGLIREPRLVGAAAGPIERWEEQVLRSIPTTRMQSAPGSSYSYSNIGYGILGLALSRAAGQPFMQLVNERVFQALGVDHDMFIVSGERTKDLAVGYAPDPDGGVETEEPAREHRGRGYKVPNGGVYTTVDELAAFVSALAGYARPALLRSDSRREMQRVQTPEDSANGYGLGLMVRTSDDGIVTYGHGGSVAGYNAAMVFEPRTGLGVVLLRNYNQGRTNLGRTARDVLLDLVRAR